MIKATEKLKGKVGYQHACLDFSNLEGAVPKVGGGNEVVKACPAPMGFAFAAGTTDGPGAFDFTQGDNQVRDAADLTHIFCNPLEGWNS